jgi:hypothetical protein
LEVEYLKFNGENFTSWERQINNTLNFVFHTNNFLNDDNWHLLNLDHQPSVIILLQSSIDKVLSTAVVGGKTPSAIYKLICNRCKQCDRQHKLNVVSRIKELLSTKRQPTNALYIQRFQEFFVKLQQKKILLEELLGLLLQTFVQPPTSSDVNAFRNNLNHRLNTLTTTPSFDRICQEITQVEGELSAGRSPSNPIAINQAQIRNQQNGKRTNNQPRTQNFGIKSLFNALAFQGLAPTPTQMADKGSSCKYCGQDGHWASNCRTLGRGIQSGKAIISRNTTGKPTQKPDQVKIRPIDTANTTSNTILIDSGASACVSGDSPFFTLETRLTQPIPVLLAS